MNAVQSKQIDALTSLRFFAALYVLLFHSGSTWLARTGSIPAFVVNFLRNGYLGVSFFFTLSGFILAYVYEGSSMRGSDVARFARARFARVYPVFLLSLLLMIPFVEPGTWATDIWQFLMLQSWAPTALPVHATIANWNMQAWTLSAELFFYAMFPLVLVGTRRLSSRSIVLCIIGACVLMAGLRLPELRGGKSVVFEWMYWIPLPVLRTPEFLYGVLLGTLFVRGEIRRSPVGLFVVFVSLIVSLCASASLWVASVAGVLFGPMIALTPGGLSSGIISRCLTSRWLVLLGQASYGVYILQLPVRFIIREYFEPFAPLIARLSYMPVLIVISIFVLRYYEEPVRELIRRSASLGRT
jgi:peptidoglycan/LPS O-acetylase OafA/YrhL